MAKGGKPGIKPRTARLIATGGSRGEHRIDAPVITIGSARGNDIVLKGDGVAPCHAEIRTPRDTSIIRDLGSIAGTHVNGNRVTTPIALAIGDEIQIGPHGFRFAPDPGRSGRRDRSARHLKAVAGLLVLPILAVCAYLFVRNWTNIERVADVEPAMRPTAASSAATTVRKRAPVLRRAAAAAPPVKIASPVPESTPSTPSSAIPVAAAVSSATSAALAGVPRGALPSSAKDWLGALNAYRASAALGPVSEDPSLSAGDLAHAKYLVENFGAQIAQSANLGAEMHREDPARPGYSPSGDAAAHHSDVSEDFRIPGRPLAPSWAVDWWMTAPFHRASILNPDLERVGYGEYCVGRICIASLDTILGVRQRAWNARVYAHPVQYPAPGSTTDRIKLFGEWPNPVYGCGYAFPAGAAVTIQIGTNVPASLGDYSLVRRGKGGGKLIACGFDQGTYRAASELEQNWGRSELHAFGEVVIVPRSPLARDATYRVTMTVNGKPYDWQFSTAR